MNKCNFKFALFRPPDNSVARKAKWRRIKTETEFNSFLDCLCKGVREGELMRKITRERDAILETLSKTAQEEQLVNVVDEEEINAVEVSVEPDSRISIDSSS